MLFQNTSNLIILDIQITLVQLSDRKVLLVLFTEQLGKTSRTCLPNQAHPSTNWSAGKYAVNQ